MAKYNSLYRNWSVNQLGFFTGEDWGIFVIFMQTGL